MKFSLFTRYKYLFIFLLIIGVLFYKMNRLLIYSSIDSLPNQLKVSSLKSFLFSMTSTESPSFGTSFNGKYFRILLWTKYFGGNQWTRLKLKGLNCSYSNCFLTDDRRHLVNSDAVLFHWRDINSADLPQKHKPNQKWVLYNWESPHYTPEEAIKPLANDIDWTMTYRKDSDVYVPYGYFEKCNRKWNNEHLFDEKSKSIAWIVSNCFTQSNREGYVKELGVFIDIDIYGYCGRHQCKRDESCFKMIEKKYKFYLSFENSLCKDYVTEKLFRTMEYDIIPVVYGSADYKQLMPNNSFIDINDFSSPKELSEFLKVVSSDKQKYNSYLKWKSSQCVRHTEYKYFCDLCQKLNQEFIKNSNNNRVVIDSNKSHRKLNIDRKGLIEWWYKEAHCLQRNNSTIRSELKFYSMTFWLFLLCLYFTYVLKE